MGNCILVLVNNDTEFELLRQILGDESYSNIHLRRCFNLPEVLSAHDSDVKAVFVQVPLAGIADLLLLQILRTSYHHQPIVLLADHGHLNTMSFNGVENVHCFSQDEVTAAQLSSALELQAQDETNFTTIQLKVTNYKRHFNYSHIPMWIYDTVSLQILEVNNAAVEKYGYSKEEFIVMSILDLHPKEDVEAFLELHEAHELDQFDTGYWRHIKKDGVVFFVNIYTHYLIHDKTETGMSFIFDVSDKMFADLQEKNSKSLIKGQKEQFDSILSTLSDAVWSIRADTLELIYANNAFYNLFGFTPEEMTANIDPFFSLIHSEDQKTFRHSMQSVTYSAPAKVEYRYNHRNGKMKTLQSHVSLIKGVSGKPDTLNGVTVDVTHERALQDKIRKSEQNLLATINNTKDLIWSVNSNLEILFCNIPYQDFVFKQSKKVPKAGDYVLGDWGSDSFIASRLIDYQRALAGESFITIIEENASGVVTFKEFSNNPIIDHDGRIIGVNCIARDITEQRKQFMKIREQNEKLIEIAWIQSHKVRSPVASILGLAELFDYQAGGNTHNGEILELIKNAARQLDDIIREVVEKTEVLEQN